MKQYRVAILGASGAVGQEMMKILAERKFPVGELHLLASARSAGKVVSWQGQNIALEEATDAAFAGMDIVLGAAENDIAERFAPRSCAPAPCSWITPRPFAWTQTCRSSCRRSTPEM